MLLTQLQTGAKKHYSTVNVYVYNENLVDDMHLHYNQIRFIIFMIALLRT